MGQLFANNASSTILGAIGAGDTVIIVQPGDGDLFPVIGATGDYFVGTLEDVSGNVEIVTVTARTADSMTVVRGAEGTPSIPYADGSRFELRVTAQTLENFAQKIGDVFTDTITTKGIDFLTTDDTVHPVFSQTYAENGAGQVTWQLAGPTTEVAGVNFQTYRSASQTWDWGIDTAGRNFGTGHYRHNWYERQAADPLWYIDQITARPAANTMQMQWIPEPSALSVSYLFRVVDSFGVPRDIVLNADGSITAAGDFQFGSMSLPLENDPTRDVFGINFRIDSLFFSGNRRTVVLDFDNISGDAGNPATETQYLIKTRDAAGVSHSVAIYSDGTVWADGNMVAVKMFVADQGVPDTLAPNELVTKTTAEQILAGGAGAVSGHFSELLYDSVGGAGGGNIALTNPLFTGPGTTHYQQFIVEAYFPSGQLGPVYQTMTLETDFLRTATDYAIGPAYEADSTGSVKFSVNASYDQLTIASQNGAVIKRVIGVSYYGDPFP